MPRLCLFDITEVTSAGNEHQLVVFGRLDSGASAALFITDTRASIYLAASPTWNSDGFDSALDAALLRGNRTAKCSRTQCPCLACARCGRLECACPCRKCGLTELACACPCTACADAGTACLHDVCGSCAEPRCAHLCGTCACSRARCACPCVYCRSAPCACKPFNRVAISSEPCRSRRLGDSQAVFGVERVQMRSLLGYEPEPRLFYRIRLKRAQYVRAASRALGELATGLPPRYAGAYEACGNAVDEFMREKGARGFGWLEFAPCRTELCARTRCDHEFYARWDDVAALDLDCAPPPITHLTLDCEMLVNVKAGERYSKVHMDPICMISVRCGAEAVVLVATKEPVADLASLPLPPAVRQPDGRERRQRSVHERGWRVETYRDERAMLAALVGLFQRFRPDFCCGYNHTKFDLPCIITRCKELGVAFDVSKLLRHEVRFLDVVNESKGKGSIGNTLVDIPGCPALDPCVELRNQNELGSYKLGHVAKALKLDVLKDEAIGYAGIWGAFFGTPETRAALAQYCADDTDVCEQILARKNMVMDVVTHAQVKRVPARAVLTRSQTYFYNCLIRDKMRVALPRARR